MNNSIWEICICITTNFGFYLDVTTSHAGVSRPSCCWFVDTFFSPQRRFRSRQNVPICLTRNYYQVADVNVFFPHWEVVSAVLQCSVCVDSGCVPNYSLISISITISLNCKIYTHNATEKLVSIACTQLSANNPTVLCYRWEANTIMRVNYVSCVGVLDCIMGHFLSTQYSI